MRPIELDASDEATALDACVRRYLLCGDEAALEECIRSTRPLLLSVARRTAVDVHEAEDAVQGAYFSLVRHRGSPLAGPAIAWLLTVVVRSATRRRARRRREDRAIERLAEAGRTSVGASDRASSPADRPDLDLLRAEVHRLPSRYADPMILHHLLGVPAREVARILDLSEGAVWTRVHRGRRLLRSRWGLAVVGTLAWIAHAVRPRGAQASIAKAAGTLGGVVKIQWTLAVAVLCLIVGGLGGAALVRAREGAPETARAGAEEARLDRQDPPGSNGAVLAAAPTPAPVAATGPAPTPPIEASPPSVAPPSDDAGTTPTARLEAALDRVDWAKAAVGVLGAARTIREGRQVPDAETTAALSALFMALAEIGPLLGNLPPPETIPHPEIQRRLVPALACALRKGLSSEEMEGLGREAREIAEGNWARRSVPTTVSGRLRDDLRTDERMRGALERRVGSEAMRSLDRVPLGPLALDLDEARAVSVASGAELSLALFALWRTATRNEAEEKAAREEAERWSAEYLALMDAAEREFGPEAVTAFLRGFEEDAGESALAARARLAGYAAVERSLWRRIVEAQARHEDALAATLGEAGGKHLAEADVPVLVAIFPPR